MKILIEIDEEGIRYTLPGTPRWPDGHVGIGKWIELEGTKQFQAVIFSEDDLDLDDPDKKHKQINIFYGDMGEL